MTTLANTHHYPFVVRNKASVRGVPANSLPKSYIGWIAKPLSTDINDFEFELYEQTLDSFRLKLIKENTQDTEDTEDTQDMLGEIFLGVLIKRETRI
jgi:hypothetical protein